ncbi:GNAT family N-acetyltransferase [Flavimaricola marinus]|uniref:Acetyltransferase (GNAT) family protein n=1 Tax=Flavimaricola marinus TaxID=1819565 RepID=A0A238LLF3_9RHOB|nr:GNAT family N-acetyltransferase [Flavimaricola marinus]SMY09690.1 Acetyltransferase (GNAT) family protein [Flavimaricola marinus]
MTTAITLATAEQQPQVLSLMERRDTEAGGAPWDDSDNALARRAVGPLLQGGSEGAIWLIGPTRAPLGYAIVTFGWSIPLAGREGWVEDVFIRPNVRRRGIGTEVLHAIAVSLRQAGLKALHVRLPSAAAAAEHFFGGAGFATNTDLTVMTDLL